MSNTEYGAELIEHMNECKSTVAIDPKDFDRTCGFYKYVRFADGVVLFCDACAYFVSHKNLVEEHPAAPPAFAGAIQTRGKRWFIKDNGSTTLNLRSGESDEKYIQKALGPKWVHSQDMWYE